MNQNNINRIIFLDIDGVLNSQNKLIEVYRETHKPHSGYNYPFDEKCLQVLKSVIEKTDSYIVITSSWRKDEEGRQKILQALAPYNLSERIVGYTPVLNTYRGDEIKKYLLSIGKPVEYVIIDDDSDLEELESRLVKTDIKTGLTEENGEEVITRFKK